MLLKRCTHARSSMSSSPSSLSFLFETETGRGSHQAYMRRNEAVGHYEWQLFTPPAYFSQATVIHLFPLGAEYSKLSTGKKPSL